MNIALKNSKLSTIEFWYESQKPILQKPLFFTAELVQKIQTGVKVISTFSLGREFSHHVHYVHVHYVYVVRRFESWIGSGVNNWHSNLWSIFSLCATTSHVPVLSGIA